MEKMPSSSSSRCNWKVRVELVVFLVLLVTSLLLTDRSNCSVSAYVVSQQQPSRKSWRTKNTVAGGWIHVNRNRPRVVPPPFVLAAESSAVVPEYSSVEQVLSSNGNDDTTTTDEIFLDSSSTAILENNGENDRDVFSATSNSQMDHINNSQHHPNVQYAALEPGTVVQIQMGDWSRARKAWKKRRRSGSPLLVPCSVLNVDRSSTVRWNLIYLLEKFGSSFAGGKSVRISLSQLMQRHHSHLKSSLNQHAAALGHESANDLVKALFNKQVQDTYGVKLVESRQEEDISTNNKSNAADTLWLQAPLSRLRAQKRASGAAILQFAEPNEESSSDDHMHDDTLEHTGFVRIRCSATDHDNKSNNSTSSISSSSSSSLLYKLKPLSAALRVHKEDLESYSNTIQKDSIHPAVVFDFDPTGDAGSPLLTLLLNPSHNQVRDRLKRSSSSGSGLGKHVAISNPKFLFDELEIGVGMQGKVVGFVKGAALVDCGVGRKLKSSHAAEDETIQVLGVINFKDAVSWQKAPSHNTAVGEHGREEWIGNYDDEGDHDEDDGENENFENLFADLDVDEDEGDGNLGSEVSEQDITHLFNLGDDGSLSYQDPETGETAILVINEDEDDDEEDEEEEEEEEKEVHSTINRRQVEKQSTPRTPPEVSHRSNRRVLQSHRLQVGDRIQVFVKSVSKQSSRLYLTMDSLSVQGKSAKDLKQETHVSKKLSRLAKQLGGSDLQQAIQELKGQEYNGIILATSETGDWFYVQPLVRNEDDVQLPVGVASVVDDYELEGLLKGDRVRIQIEGIDQSRGQLAMRVLRKLAP